jgi:V/A-type H+/Na+-transporting ATPase subunit D
VSIALNKTALKEQRDQLAMYQRFLPSLDLKRQQLVADYQRARRVAEATEREFQEAMAAQNGLMKLLGASEQDLSGLVVVRSVSVGEESLLGTRLPVLVDVSFQRTDYAMLAKPFWVDFLAALLQDASRLTIRLRVEQERVRRLGEAVRKITQRVNLFEKVLIPKAGQNIQRIRIYLADAERAAVVRSKIAKSKQHRDRSIREVF